MNSKNNAISLEIDKNGIANLIFNACDQKVNKLSIQVLEEFEQNLEKIKNDSQIKILIISSAKKDNFIAGADINEIKVIIDEKDAQQKISRGQNILDKIAQLKIPTIAVIRGSCLGGGLELALACQYRVGIIHSKTMFGLPEVNLGVIPGFGGTLRLPALVGLEESLKIILSGKAIDINKALKIGLIDLAIHKEFFEQKLPEFINEILANPSRNNYLKSRFDSAKKRAIIEKLLLKKHLIFHFANKDLWNKTKGQYLAPFYALEVIRKTYGKKVNKRTLGIEREAFVELVIGEISKNLIEIFFTNEALKKDYLNEDAKDFSIQNSALLGAGIMGGGIAWLFANNNIKIRIKDISQKAIALGYNQVLKNFNFLKKIRKLSDSQVNMKIANISSGLDFTGFNNVDLVIEAVIENIEIKNRTLIEVEKFVRNDALIVSNTSSLSISQMAKSLKNPARFAGMHFFNPVNRMPLVEIIRGQETDEKTISQLVKITRDLGKTPIVVKDVAGFLVNRVLLPYILEATYLAQQGAKIVDIDYALEKFGMPMGPFILADTVGIDVGLKVMHSLFEAYGSRMKISEFMAEFENHRELLGKKTQKGFYIYDQNKSAKKPIYNSEIDQILSKIKSENNIKNTDFSFNEIVERTMLVMINESSKCLEENVVKNASYLDMAMIMGAGFPAFRGGVLRYADKIGIANIVTKLQTLETKFSQRYKASDLLIKMAKDNQKFYE
jgi:3-hydroxyacyl-CoA dehydrogenase/enoyl-CoA hydratase/3-hydroxybutyryl-CoA epimerase